MFEQPVANENIEKLLADRDVVRRVGQYIDTHFFVGERAGEKHLLQRSSVSYLNQFVEKGEPLEDALGRPLDLRLQGPRGVLLLIDPEPDANWGHLCWIAAYDERHDELTDKVVENFFPPRQETERRLRSYTTLDAHLSQV